MTALRIGIVGGIFDKPDGYRRHVPVTPETVLAEGLATRGHQVTTWGHRRPFPDGDFDVVHVHHLGRGTVRALTSRRPFAFVFTGHADPGAPVSSVRRLVRRSTLRRADAVVALSETEAAVQRSRYGVDGQRQRVIPNGVDAGRFTFGRRYPAADGEPWRLLFVGQLVALKRVDVLLEAMALLRWDLAVTLNLVFHVNDELDTLRQLSNSLGVDDAVRFLGPRSPDQLADLYRASHAAVLSSDTESLPTVVTEAMLTGTPVVATDVGSVREQLAGSGFLVPPGDPEAFTNAVRVLVGDYDRHLDRASAVSAGAAARFSRQAMVDAHEALYQELVERRPRRPLVHRFRPVHADAVSTVGP